MGTHEPLSAFIVCCNEEHNMRRCLQSLSWCDEVVVVDSGSTDGTLEICKEFGARVIHNPWGGFVAQKRFALAQCSYDWCLNLDADEEVSEELRAEIIEALSKDSPINGYKVSRVVFHLGRWWRKGGWYPEYRLRLVRRSKTNWGGEDPHERAEVSGAVGALAGELRHYTYDDLADQIDTVNRFSSIAARSMFKREQEGTRRGTPLFIMMFANPIARFFKFYFVRKGYREGMPGLVVAIIESFGVFLKYAKRWEIK